MICESCNADINERKFRLSIALKCETCGSLYYPTIIYEEGKKATYWYIGIFAFIFVNSILQQVLSKLYSLPVGIAAGVVFGAAVFIPLYRNRPTIIRRGYVKIEKSEYPLKKQDAIIVGSIFMLLIFITIVIYLYI